MLRLLESSHVFLTTFKVRYCSFSPVGKGGAVTPSFFCNRLSYGSYFKKVNGGYRQPEVVIDVLTYISLFLSN